MRSLAPYKRNEFVHCGEARCSRMRGREMLLVPKNSQALETALGGLLDDPEFHNLDKRLGRFNLFEAVGGIGGSPA